MPAAFLLALALAQAAGPLARERGEPPVPAVAARPLQPLGSLFRSSDYPLQAYSFNAQGTVDYRLIVGVNGRVRRCRVVRSSWVSLFGSITCAILRERARFEPARDGAGNPAQDVVAGTIRWGISGLPQRIPPVRRRPRR